MSINSSKRTGKDHLTKPVIQSQLARLKREEEEDLWISGEELCTEGSSDEEDNKTPSRTYRTNKSQDSRNSSASGSRHHWVISESTRNATEGYTDQGECNKSINSNSEENSLSSSELANSSIAESQNMRSNSSIQSDTNASQITEDTCSDVAQDDDDEEEVEEEDDEGQGLKDSEISWKVNRDIAKSIAGSIKDESTNAMLRQEEDTTELDELKRLDYQEGFNFISGLRDKFRTEDIEKDGQFVTSEQVGNTDVSLPDDNEKNGTYLRNGVNECESKDLVASDEELKKQITQVQSLDAVIQKFDNNVEEEMRETSLCQYKNRERLREILANKPLESGKLAENTRQFLNMYNERVNVPEFVHTGKKLEGDKVKEIDKPPDQQVSKIRKANSITSTQEESTDEKLSEKKQKANKFSKRNKTSVTCRSTTFPHADQARLEKLLQDTTADSNDKSVNCSSNPYCINDDEKKLLHELKEKHLVLQTNVVHKNSKTFGTRVNTKLLTTTCNIRTSLTKTKIPMISTESTITTLQNINETILME